MEQQANGRPPGDPRQAPPLQQYTTLHCALGLGLGLATADCTRRDPAAPHDHEAQNVKVRGVHPAPRVVRSARVKLR